MGNGQSSSHAHPPARALHVLRVTPSSPASQTTLEPFFDFVVGFDGDSLTSQNGVDVTQLERIVESHEGRILNLLVWNSKNQGTRVVPIVPSRAWSMPHPQLTSIQEPEGDRQPSLLGLSMRMCEPGLAMDNVWHVMDVLEGSPAESAGLVPYGDWIVGWSGGILSAEGDFYALVEAHIEKPLRVYVYSYDFDTLREVVLVPNRHWGGEGLLGCVFGFGLLHRIPPRPLDQPGEIPSDLHETLDEYEEQELFVPADLPEKPYDPEEQEDWNQETYATRPMHEDIHHQYFGHMPHPDDEVGHGDQAHSRSQRNSYDTDQTLPAHGRHKHHPHHLDERSLSNEISAAQSTPHSTSTLATNSISTPTRSYPFGTLMNGTGTARILSPRAGTPVAGFRSPLSHFPGFKHENSDENEDEGDADCDGETSVTGTSDTNSLGSLTSVE